MKAEKNASISVRVALVIAATLCAIALAAGFATGALPRGGFAATATASAPASGQPAAAVPAGVFQESARNAEAAPGDSAYEPDVVLASLATDATPDQALADLAANPTLAGIALDSVVSGTIVKLALPATVSADEAVALVQESPFVTSAQLNHYYFTQEGAAGDQGETIDSLAPPALASAATLEQPAFAAAATTRLQTQTATPNDPSYVDGTQWGLPSARFPEAWSAIEDPVVASTTPVTVAVIDAGFDVNHPDLKANVIDQYDAAHDTANIAADNPDLDQANHGTHVAGLIAAHTNNALGVAGATNNACNVLPIRVQDNVGTGIIADDYLVRAYAYVNAHAKEYNIKLVNMSLGGATYKAVDRSDYPLLYDAIAEARENGVLTVVAACNAGTRGTDKSGRIVSYSPPFNAYPSDFDNVVSVICLTQSSNATVDNGVARLSSSNYNVDARTCKNISAPGGEAYGLYTIEGGSYDYKSGTSMAAPLVSSAMALMFKANPTLSLDDAIRMLYGSAYDLTTGTNMAVGWDVETGYGEVDVAAAVAAVMPQFSNAPQSVDVGATATFAISAVGAAQNAAQWKWTSSNPAVASVANGVVTGVGAGSATIAAECSGMRLESPIAVADPGTSSGGEGGTGGESGEGGAGQGSGQGEPSSGGTQPQPDPDPKTDLATLSIRIPPATYSGLPHVPQPVVMNGTTPLVSNVDYTVTCANASPVDAGSYSVEITGIGSYAGTVTRIFTIEPKSIAGSSVSLNRTSFAFTGETITPTVKSTTPALVSSDYDVTFSSPVRKAVGDYAVTLVGKGNYTGTASTSFSIVKAANPLKASLATAKKIVKASAVRHKQRSYRLITVKGAQGNVVYRKASSSPLTLKANGKIVVRKGMPKGTYKIKVTVIATGNASYLSAAKTLTVKLRVK